MPEPIFEKLLKLAEVMHWLGKYEECNALTIIAVRLKEQEVRELDQLEVIIKSLKWDV